MRIIAPKSDVGAKEMFRNEIVLKYFISDMFGIPVEKIRSIRLRNTFLKKIRRNQKQGIQEAIRELKTMSLGKRLRMEYEAHLKAVRDRKAEDEYVLEEGIRQGEREAIENVVRNALAEGMSDEAIKRLTQCDQSLIDAVRNSINA